MKKALSVLLACLLVFSTVPVFVSAAEADKTPLVILQGYSGPRLDNADTGEQVWGLDFSKVGDRIVSALPDIAGTAGEAFQGDTTRLVDILGGILQETLDPIRCNPDGSSYYNIVPHIKTAEQARVSTLRANGEENLVAEKELVEMMASERGADNIFIFNHDWREGQIAYAKAIDEFIQEVKALTGAKQVDIFGLSHGGQCGASYLYYYGYKKDVRRVVLDSPAIGGTYMLGDPMLGVPLNVDFATILEFVELGNGTEEEFEWLIKYIGFENLNEVLSELCERYLVDLAKNIPSLWDFCPLEIYEEAKEKRLDPIENAQIIENSDKFHYEAMAHMSEGLKKAQDEGISVSILTKYGHENLTGSNKNSDYIIETALSSGAYCAPFDGKFSADYTAEGTNCSNENHMHISPERNVDASCAYLPDNTWFINGQFHGMYVFDPYTKELVKTLLSTDSLKNVFSDPKFPQFNYSHNPVDSMFVRFDGTSPGYHSSADKKLLITNLSSQYEASVWYIQINGAEFELKPNTSQRLAAGETGSITLPEHLLSDCSSPFEITVIYTLYNRQTQLRSKTFEFTPLSEQDASRYSYLITAATANGIKDLSQAQQTQTPEQPADNPVTDAPSDNTPAENTATVSNPSANNEIPKTGGEEKSIIPFIFVLSALICTAACTVIIYRRRQMN